MNGLISYIDISNTAITAPTVVGTATTVNTTFPVDDFKAIGSSANMFVVKFKVGTTVYEMPAVHIFGSNGGTLEIHLKSGLNLYTYFLAVSLGKVVLTGYIYKAAAPT